MSFKLVGIGELLWDMLPGGRQMGGAPANFAYHAAALGAEAFVISRVGNDNLGRELIERLGQLNLPVKGIEIDPVLPSGTVSVEVDADGQPKFTIHEKVAWDALKGEPAGRRAAGEADAVCFGTLAQREEQSRATIRALVGGTPKTALRILDVNLRQNYYSRQLIEESLALSNVLKVNDTELPRLSEIFQLEGNDVARLAQLASRFSLRLVALTRGGHGSLLFSEGRSSEHPGVHTDVVDTVGAGDSFTAAMTLGFLAGWDLDRINLQANRVAAYVCGFAGATPTMPPELRREFETIG